MGVPQNVAGHVTLGLETVLRELWDMGYTPAAGLFSAAEVGAPHQRLRIFILAHTDEPASRHKDLQPGGQQRFYPQGGSAGAGHRQLVDTEDQRRDEGWAGSELWCGRHNGGRHRRHTMSALGVRVRFRARRQATVAWRQVSKTG